MNPTNKINRLTIISDKLYLEGLAYIEGFNSPDHTSLFRYLRLQNQQTNEILEYELGTVPNKNMKAQLYKGQTYDYTAAGVATVGFEGIPIDKLSHGVYELQISVSNNKSVRNYLPLNLDNPGHDLYSHNHFSAYRLFMNKNKVYLVKRDIFGRVPAQAFVEIEKQWAVKSKFHIEGSYLIPGVDLTELTQGKYFLIMHKSSTQKQYTFELGRVCKDDMGSKIDNPFGNYNTCYYATLKLEGIDTKGFELGDYNLYLSLAYKSEIFTYKLDQQVIVDYESCGFI